MKHDTFQKSKQILYVELWTRSTRRTKSNKVNWRSNECVCFHSRLLFTWEFQFCLRVRTETSAINTCCLLQITEINFHRPYSSETGMKINFGNIIEMNYLAVFLFWKSWSCYHSAREVRNKNFLILNELLTKERKFNLISLDYMLFSNSFEIFNAYQIIAGTQKG